MTLILYQWEIPQNIPPPSSELHTGSNTLPDESCDQDQLPIFSNSKGPEVKDVQIKWADGRTSWVKLGKLKFEGDLDIGLSVKVKWGKHKKLFEGEVLAISYKPEIADNTTDNTQGTRKQHDDGGTQSSRDETLNTPTPIPTGSERPTCTTCYGVFRPQYRPLMCSADGCTILVHKQQICSGFNKDQQQNVNWLCRDHGGNGPTPRGKDQVNDQECVSDNCIYCLKKFRTNLSPIICSVCERGSHASCSGLQRGEIAKLKKSGKWICSPCSGDTPIPNIGQEKDLPKGKCLQCKGAIREGVRRARCLECQQLSHRGCTGLTKSAMDPVLNSNNWMCNRCTTRIQFPQNLPDTDILAGKHEPKFTGGAKSLRIMQWNADGINTKIAELNHFVKEHKIDVVIIQESKLTENKPTPKLYGYAAVRSDRPGSEFPGGGLLTYIKHNVAYRKVGSAKNGNVEAQSVSIQQSANRWLDITNIYIPPKAKENNITWIPTSEAAILAGDLNGHTPLWDRTQPSDEMGDKIVDYILEKNLFCCNTGEATRHNWNTGGGSTPDITLATPSLANKVKWTIGDDLGSDHLPIIITVDNIPTKRHVKKQRRRRWRRKGGDWIGFCQRVEERLGTAGDQNTGINERVKRLNDILIEAGKEFIGTSVPRTSSSWMNPGVRAKVRKRNQLRRDIANKRSEWLEACKEANIAVQNAKQEAWVQYLEEIEFGASPDELWRIIKSLDGSPDSLAPNEALIVKGKVITTNPKKADAFAKHYASVSKLSFSKEERAINLQLKKRIREEKTKTKEEVSCREFDMCEMDAAIKSMKKNGAPGKDNIPPSFLKNLGTLAKQELLDLFNESFRTANIPSIWKHAIIIPILKAGKPASQLSSYRPISLTSCMVKVLERMIGSRLYYLAETEEWFCKTQAGFRKQQSTEDQILRFVQNVSDGFQEKPAKRTIMVQLDYSKAYDRVWRQRLLLDMIEIGVPMQMVLWFRSFLTDRRAQVLYNGSYSRDVLMCQGLPQGAVTSPLLFLFYINGLSEAIPGDVENALFADDASIWTSDCDLNKANTRLQRALNKIEEWSTGRKMDLNVSKSEVSFYSTSTKEAKWRPNLTVCGKTIPYNECPKFLGVHLDRSLAFQKHVEYTTKKVEQRCRVLACLASKEWGWRKKHLRQVYITTQRTVLDYAASAWQPWLSNTSMNKLETAQNAALRLVTGQYRSTPVEALRKEAGVESYKVHSKKILTTASEKADRLDNHHPKYLAKNPPSPPTHRSKVRSSWRREVNMLEGELPSTGAAKQKIPSPFSQPWANPDSPRKGSWTIFRDIPEMPPQHEDQQSIVGPSIFSTWANTTPWNSEHHDTGNKAIVEQIVRKLDSYDINTTIYTDGSCTSGISDGGSAVIITTGTARNPVEIERIMKKGGKFTCSYEEEKRAMIDAVMWMQENQKHDDTIICSDSLSLLIAIDSNTADTQEIRDRLNTLNGRTFIHWVPSHINIPGNEIADRAAKEAAKMDSEEELIPVSYEVAKALVKRTFVDPETQHPVVAETYKEMSTKKDNLVNNRRDACLLAQLRSGHCKQLAHYANRIDDKTSPMCKKCNEEPETVGHWLKCPATIMKRQQHFGKDDVDLGILSRDPEGSLAFAKATLL